MLKKFIILMILIGIGIFIWLVVLYSKIKLDVNKIVNYKPTATSQIVDRNGKLLSNIFLDQHRFYVKFDKIPPKVIESLIAIEDTQFFEHNGINVDAILRAIVKDLKHMKMVEGASTITQQLVRTIALSRDKKIMRKIKEILLSLKLERVLSKEDILERYLNSIYFGHGYYGIRTASLGYFHKELDQLNIKEISILVGLPQAPSFYAPTKNLKFSLARANQVVRRLNTLGWINNSQYNEALKFTPKIYNETLTRNKAPYAVDYALKELKNKIKDLKTGGYIIKLTIDLEAQLIAKEALKYGYDKIKKRDKYVDTNKSNTKSLNGAIISIENSTGKILTLVGGVDYKKSSFNRATQSKRQPGSAVKPFVYQTALNLGYSTVSNLVDISRTFEYEDKSKKDKYNKTKKWKPGNYESNFKGMITLREALVHSRNLATINLVNEMGIDVIHENLELFGFKNLPLDLSIALGSFGISPLDLSEIYTIISNNGVKVKPYIIESIKNKDGEIINFDTTLQEIQSKEQSFLMTTILQDVVTRGTARRAKVKGLQVAGKTGTTNNYKDAWFCGYSPSIQTIVWFGNDNYTPMGRKETGGGSAAPVFSYFYKSYLNIHPELKRKFDIPKDIISHRYNGKMEYFTQTSPMPQHQIIEIKTDSEEEIEF